MSLTKSNQILLAQRYRLTKILDTFNFFQDYMPTDDIAIPVTVTVIVMGIYIVGGAVVFSEWEDWDILSSIYFTWV